MHLKIPDDARMEIKFITDETNHHTLIHWLRLHNYGFVEHHTPRSINNIYFDTYDYETFDNNLSGASSRVKVRYRWYSESLEPDAGTLEIKCKRNYFSWKLAYKVDEKLYQPNTTWRQLTGKLASALPGEGKKWLINYPQPILINHYDRRYFASFDNNLRVTIDTNHNVWDQRYKPYLNFKHSGNMRKMTIVEVKFERKHRQQASELIHGLPLRVTKHSKYISGIFAITGY